MRLDDLRKQAQFQTLTEKERKFVELYLESEGDWYGSIKQVYVCNTPKMTGQTSRRLRNRPFVMGLIRMIDGVHMPKKDELIAEGWSAILACESGPAKASLLQFVAKLSGFLDDKSGNTNAKSLEDFLKELDNGKVQS